MGTVAIGTFFPTGFHVPWCNISHSVFPKLLIQPVEADEEHFSGQHSTFLYGFLDAHSPGDQMAPFVLKENSYRISTFDIKMYTG